MKYTGPSISALFLGPLKYFAELGDTEVVTGPAESLAECALGQAEAQRITGTPQNTPVFASVSLNFLLLPWTQPANV